MILLRIVRDRHARERLHARLTRMLSLLTLTGLVLFAAYGWNPG